MKNLIFTLFLSLATTLAFSQVKVITNGNVGIGGIANPTAALDVNGKVYTTDELSVAKNTTSFNAFIRLGQGRSANGVAAFDLISDVTAFPTYGFRFLRNQVGNTIMYHSGDKAFRLNATGAAPIQFFTDNTIRLNVNTVGNTGLGTAFSNHRLNVAGDVQATDFITASDTRLKEDIQDFDSGLDKLMEIKTYTYTYNGKAGINSKLKHYGVIAQEFEKIMPEAVGEFDWANMNAEGELTTDVENYKYVQTEAIKYILVNAVKEQQAIIESQEERLNKLEEQLAILLEGNNQSIDISGGDTSKAVLGDNYPNPFGTQTDIRYFVPEETQNAVLNVFDNSGKLIRSVKITERGNGVLNVNFSDMPAGIYNYQMVVDDKLVATKKMILGSN